MNQPHTSTGADLIIVDDDRLVLVTLGSGLRSAGFTVREAASGDEALRLCAEQRPDLVLLDTRMPGLSGIEVAAELRELGIPFLFLSAYGDHDVVKQAVEQGASTYLVKPVDVPQIVPAIQAALARAAELQRLSAAQQHLSTALASGRETSVAIGIIMERHRLGIDAAFEALRYQARSQRRKVGEVALELVRAVEEINTLNKVHNAGRRSADKTPES